MLERIRDGRTDLVFDFLAEGHPAQSTDERGVPLIRWCAYYGDVSAIRHLLANGETLSSLGDNLDMNGAVFHGHWRLCQFLIENGADVNHPLPETAETPLHSATVKPDRPAFDLIVELLLAHGADPNKATLPGVESGSFMREARTRGETPLHRAAAFGSLRAIDLLIEAGADREARDGNGDSPLSWASWHGRPAFILERLCFGEHRIHPQAVERSRREWGTGWGAMEGNLLGRPHF